MNNNYCEYCGERNQDLFDYKTYIGNIEHYCPRCYVYVNYHNFVENLNKDMFFRFIIPDNKITNADAKCNCGETEDLTEVEENGNIKYYCGYCYGSMRYEQFIEKMEKEVNAKIKDKVDIRGVMGQYLKDKLNEEETGEIVIYPPDDYH